MENYMEKRSIIDLTLPISVGGAVPPRMPRPIFKPIRTFEKDGCQTSYVSFYNHAGTHVDAGSHFLPEGPTVDTIELDLCLGPTWVADVSHLKQGDRIQKDDLGSVAERLEPGDRILLYTGWDQYYPHEKYYKGFPAVSLELAQWFALKRVSLIGIDAGSIAALNDWNELTEVHNILLNAEIILVEGLTNLGLLPADQQIELIVLPLKLEGLDGAPVRAVAIL
jgi:arylformamidase